MRTISNIPLMIGAMILVSGGAASGMSAIGIKAALHNCQNPDVAPESRIEACSEVIHTNLAPQDIRARIYYHRGTAYEAAHDFDHARQDYDKALELAPQYAEAETARARLINQHPTTTSVASPGSN